jgi:hypothetical protein
MKYKFLMIASLMALSACGGASEFRKQLGVNKAAPDEFAVLRRAPLEVPPPYGADALPLPTPGAPRPQEKPTDQAARQALTGVQDHKARLPQTMSAAEKTFLLKSGTDQADPNVRDVIDSETAALHDINKPVAERLFNYGGDASVPSATVVDAKAEAQRIKDNLAAGKSITDGETPSIEE